MRWRHDLRRLACGALAALLVGPFGFDAFAIHRHAASAESASSDRFADATMEELSDWLTFYYRSKQPEDIPSFIRRSGAEGLLRGKTLPPLLGFLTGFVAESPDHGKAALAAARSLPAPDYQAVVIAVILGTKPQSEANGEARGALDAYGRKLLAALDAAGIRAKDDVRPISPHALDFLWGVFFATGDAHAVLPIVATIVIPQDSRDAMELAVHGAARWSLRSNARQHPAIMKLCRQEIAHQPPEIAAELREIVAGE